MPYDPLADLPADPGGCCPACYADVPHDHRGPLAGCPHYYGPALPGGCDLDEDDAPGCCVTELVIAASAAAVVVEAQRITRRYHQR